jgi:predicted MPP superfamily phosphohydrolase
LVLVTGDICEAAHFISWVEDVLGPVESRLGKFFVLGNHDLRTHDVPRLRAALAHVGFTDLSGVWKEIPADGARIVLGGDERPWLGEPLDPHQAPPRLPDVRELRLVLLHTPDRLSVARAADADLVLAGHTHGGQIRMPWIGAIVCPSWYGMRYDAGWFHFPPTSMYVGRGLSGLTPLRVNCRPELTRLVLRRPGATSSGTP